MKLLLLIGLVYGLLSITAGTIQIKNIGPQVSIWPNIIMLIGGLLVSICSGLRIFAAGKTHINTLLILFIVGLVLIQIAAIFNGMNLYVKIHIQHHIIRLLLSLFLIVVFSLS